MFENWTNVLAAAIGLAVSYLVLSIALQPKVIRFTVKPPAGKYPPSKNCSVPVK